MTARVRLGLKANAGQFALLVGLNALVGAMVGLERSVLPLVGKQDFGLRSNAAILAFVVAFGLSKALTNLGAGDLAERLGRKRVLVVGWLVALPVPLLIGLASSWWYVVAANLLLGVNQGLAWSMTVVMKIDLAGPERRGLALGLNEAAGYLGVAVAALGTGVLAATYAPRTVVWVGAAMIAAAGLVVSIVAVRDTGGHVAREQELHGDDARPRLDFEPHSYVPASVTRCYAPAARRGSSTTSTTRLPGGWRRCTWPRTERACVRSRSSRPSTRSSGVPASSSPAGSPTPWAASR